MDPRKSGTAWDERKTYQALDSTDLQTCEDLAGLVTVADVLESLCAVLAGYVEEDLLTTTAYSESVLDLISPGGVWGERCHVRVLIDEAGAVVDLVVDDEVEILLGVVLSDLLEGEFFGGGHFCDWIIGLNWTGDDC